MNKEIQFVLNVDSVKIHTLHFIKTSRINSYCMKKYRIDMCNENPTSVLGVKAACFKRDRDCPGALVRVLLHTAFVEHLARSRGQSQNKSSRNFFAECFR